MTGEKTDDNIYTKYIFRPISTKFAEAIASDAKALTPNQITILSFTYAILSIVMFLPGDYMLNIWGAFIVAIAYILDLCDGQVARMTNNVTGKGAWLDNTLDQIKDTLVLVAIYVGYTTTHTPTTGVTLLMVAAIASISTHNLAWYLKKLYLPIKESGNQQNFNIWKTLIAPTGSLRVIILLVCMIADQVVALFVIYTLIHTASVLKELWRMKNV